MRFFSFCILLIFASFTQALIKPADGLWHTADDPAIGSGLVLTTQNGITLISLFTYRENGENVWYVGSGQVDVEGVLEVSLYQTENGQSLLIDNPQSANLIGETDSLRIEFFGSNQASMQINGSDVKTITPLHFGHNTSYGFPDLTGQWAVANLASNQSYVLDLSLDFEGQLGSQIQYCYVNANSNTPGCAVSCVIDLAYPNTNLCAFTDPNDGNSSSIFVNFENLGNKKIQGKTEATNADFDFQLFRINQAPNILPNDGHWRTVDDPDVGSGLVMRTQGEYTVVLVYSYDEVGKPEWKIASGQFDENGLFSAELMKPYDGSSIQNAEQFVALLEPQSQAIEIQVNGLELASLSIDGSEPKMIQNYNFGVELFETEHFTIKDEPYQFPSLKGHWLSLKVGQSFANAYLIQFGYGPYYRGDFNRMQYDDPVSMKMFCPLFLYESADPYCTGTVEGSDYIASTYALFQNMGYRQFKLGDQNQNVSGLFIRID